MKKTLFAIMALTQVMAFSSNGYNIYLKGGITYGSNDKVGESFSNFQKSKIDGDEFKKFLTGLENEGKNNGSASPHFQGTLDTEENKEKAKKTFKNFVDGVNSLTKQKINGIVSIDITKDISENFEFGVGAGYIFGSKSKTTNLTSKEISGKFTEITKKRFK